MTTQMEPLTLLQLNQRIQSALTNAPGMKNVWIVAETSDVRVQRHCYLELLQKDDEGKQIAKARAVIWSSRYQHLASRFEQATGSPLKSDMKVLVLVDVNYSSIYGLSLVVNDINPEYTVGDLVRRRNEIIARLKAEGIFDLNRTLEWPRKPNRIAVISARGAAGYGDFIKHLYGNSRRLRFSTTLFESSMQGEGAPTGIIAALQRIMDNESLYDCVVVIRGGGAVSDLSCFDNYALAAAMAQFPLPVIVGIGHERDVTVLDYVANIRVKTPTAAAEELIAKGEAEYEYLCGLARNIHTATTDKLSGQHSKLERYRGQIPAFVRALIRNRRTQLERYEPQAVAHMAQSVIERERMHLNNKSDELKQKTKSMTEREQTRLKGLEDVIDALNPQATLKRGYSVTRLAGHAVKDVASLSPDTVVEITLANGCATAVISDISQ